MYQNKAFKTYIAHRSDGTSITCRWNVLQV